MRKSNRRDGVGFLAAAAVPVVFLSRLAAEFDANKPIKLTGTVTKMSGSIHTHSCTST